MVIRSWFHSLMKVGDLSSKQTSYWQGFLWFQQSRKYHWQLLCVKWLVIKECMAISTIKKMVIHWLSTIYYSMAFSDRKVHCHGFVTRRFLGWAYWPSTSHQIAQATWISLGSGATLSFENEANLSSFCFLWKKIGLHLFAFSSNSWMGMVVICTATGFSFSWFPSLVQILLSDRLQMMEPRPFLWRF